MMNELLFTHSTSLGPAGKVEVKEIYLGSIDVTNELDIGGKESEDDFFKTYLVPEYISIKDFLEGKILFACGLKGTGKTALLNYLGQHIKRNDQLKSDGELFRFRSDFPVEIYEDLRSAYFESETRTPSKDDSKIKINIFQDVDYENVWEFIFLENISRILERDKNGKLALNNKEKRDFIEYIQSISKTSVRQKVMTFLPNISNGKVTISSNSSIKFDFDFDNEEKREISFSKYMKKIKNLFQSLTMGEFKYYTFIDELDPRVGGGHLFQLDLILIRDLIATVLRLNALFPKEKRGFFFIAAVRSEVLSSVSTLAKETHKTLEQFSISMNWGDVSSTPLRHPLIKMISKKILYSEQKKGIVHNEATDPEAYVWSRYFKKNKHQQMAFSEVFDLTWMRPRDIVRLLRLCQQETPKQYYFSQQTLLRIRKRYSQQCWDEIKAQLAAFLDPQEISGIEKVLLGFKQDFSRSDFRDRIESQEQIWPQVKQLCKSKADSDIISILYRNGVLGNNQHPGFRFDYRGDSEVQMDLDFRVHKALWSRFNLLGPPRGIDKLTAAGIATPRPPKTPSRQRARKKAAPGPG